MNKILVPLDFSPCSDNALRYAIEFAKRMDASLTLLHVYHIPAYNADMPIPEEALNVIRESAIKTLEEIKARILKENNLEVHIKAEPGFSAMTIEEESKAMKATMIIMGTQGANGLKRAVMGSHAAYVCTHASVPVLAIPEMARFTGINKVVIASEFLDAEYPLLREFIEGIKPFRPDIEILHIVESEKETQEATLAFRNKLESYLSYPKITVSELYGNAVQQIGDHTAFRHTDMLVMINHKRNIFQKIFTRSITKEFVFRAQVPLLALHLPH